MMDALSLTRNCSIAHEAHTSLSRAHGRAHHCGDRVRRARAARLARLTTRAASADADASMGTSSTLLPVFGAAAGAMLQVLLIGAVGFVCAKRPKDPGPLLSPEALRHIARLANDVFLPFLAAAVLGARINVANMQGDWVLLWAVIQVWVASTPRRQRGCFVGRGGVVSL